MDFFFKQIDILIVATQFYFFFFSFISFFLYVFQLDLLFLEYLSFRYIRIIDGFLLSLPKYCLKSLENNLKFSFCLSFFINFKTNR